MDTVSAIRDLRSRNVKICSLAESEAMWATYLDADPDTPEALIGDVLTTFMAWAAHQELEAVSRRTRAGLEKGQGRWQGPGAPTQGRRRRPGGRDGQTETVRAWDCGP